MKPRTALSCVGRSASSRSAAGWYFGAAHASRPSRPRVTAGTLVFPDLATKLQMPRRVEITHRGRPGDRQARRIWGLADRGGYPVQPAKLRAMLTGLTELRLVEPRTADPAVRPPRVEDPNGKTARTPTCCACSTPAASRSSS